MEFIIRQFSSTIDPVGLAYWLLFSLLR